MSRFDDVKMGRGADGDARVGTAFASTVYTQRNGNSERRL
jgi:hypothetical protein